MTTPHNAYTRVCAAFRSPAALAGLPADTPVLLGLSGGADSRLLLHFLAKECKESGAPLYLAHVHHGIRGAEADRDEQFCRALATCYHLPISVCHADVPALARERGESVEAVARCVRYDFFADLMREQDIPLLVTAHNADDNLETLLLHLARGCGLSGLGGIAPVRPFERKQGSLLVRPLLGCSKADILQACAELTLDFVTDSTNADTAYARNLVRAQILPALSRLADHPEQQVLRSCQMLREDEELLDSLAQKLLMQAGHGNAVNRHALAQEHPAIAKRALRLWIHAHGGYWPEAAHIEAALHLCHPDCTTGQVHLPRHLTLKIARDELQLRHENHRERSTPPDFDLAFSLGEQTHPTLGFRLSVNELTPDQHQTITQNEINVYNPFIRDTLIFDTIIACATPDHTPVLHWRNRREGDTLLLHGVNRRLRKLQNEVGIPPELRDRLPLLCDGDTVLWAPFVGARDGAFSPVTPATRHPISLTIEFLPREANYAKEDLS